MTIYVRGGRMSDPALKRALVAEFTSSGGRFGLSVFRLDGSNAHGAEVVRHTSGCVTSELAITSRGFALEHSPQDGGEAHYTLWLDGVDDPDIAAERYRGLFYGPVSIEEVHGGYTEEDLLRLSQPTP